MEFGFTEEQLMIQDVARRIAQEKVAPSAEHFDRTGEFPLDNIRTLGENGLMGIEVPAEYGGAGMDPVSYVLAMVEIADLYRASGRVADASVLALSARQLASGPGIGLNAAQADRFESVIASIGTDGVQAVAVAVDAPHAVELALTY